MAYLQKMTIAETQEHTNCRHPERLWRGFEVVPMLRPHRLPSLQLRVKQVSSLAVSMGVGKLLDKLFTKLCPQLSSLLNVPQFLWGRIELLQLLIPTAHRHPNLMKKTTNGWSMDNSIKFYKYLNFFVYLKSTFLWAIESRTFLAAQQSSRTVLNSPHPTFSLSLLPVFHFS